MAKRVQIDPWPAGSFGNPHEEGRRISRCIFYLRESATDNGYARPIEGLIAFFDQGGGKVLEVLDLGTDSAVPEIDYVSKAHDVADAIVAGRVERGVLVTRSGVGSSFAANKIEGVRAGSCSAIRTRHARVSWAG